MTLKLYFAPGACSFAALVGLEEAGADFEPARLNFAEADQRKPEFLAVNPRGRVPTLVIDGAPLTENVAVLSYIARRFSEARLLPLDGSLRQARADELMAWFASGVHVAFANVFRPERFIADEAIRPVLAAGGRRAVLAAYDELEQRLAGSGGDWFLGEDFSLIDPYAYVFWRWGDRLELDRAPYPAFNAHAARLRARPSVQRALAHEAGQVAVAAAG